MKFLLDHNVYGATARLLRVLGHDVVTAGQLGYAAAADQALLTLAQTQGRIMATRDRDFGELVFAQGLGAGVIYLRITPTTQNAVHLELTALLQMHSEAELLNAFVVVEPGRHRFRKLAP